MNTTDIGGALPFAGIAVQWLRAQRGVPEWVTMVVQVVIGVGAYALVHKGIGPDVWQSIVMTMGATQATSSLANAGVAVLPRTNSKD